MPSCLVLAPVNQGNLITDQSCIVDLLSRLQLIGNPLLQNNIQYYQVGNEYLNLISFLGCSPTFEFSIPSDIKQSGLDSTNNKYYYIKIIIESNKTRFMHSDFSVKARCPNCRKHLPNWKKLIVDWTASNTSQFQCVFCQIMSNVEKIEWGKSAGFVSTSIELYGIQAELAVPSDKLLDSLGDSSKTKWKYFFG